MYKAFEDFYKEATIKHLLLEQHNDVLISPPFATDKCKDYSKIAVYENNKIRFINLDLPPATSKTNAVAKVKDSSYLIPYAIWDDYNIVVQLTDNKVDYHELNKKGKGQFYSVASNGDKACSFPLGYEDTQYLIYIDDSVKTVPLKNVPTKAHMGTVYCNDTFWSMPRSETNDYNNLVSYDGKEFTSYTLPKINNVSRKYSDIVVKENTLYSLPFGETAGLKTVIEFNTDSKEFKQHELDVPDYAKKFNSQVLIEDKIVGLPYGDEEHNDSNYGVIFDTTTKTSKAFDIELGFGGKYRYRSGIQYKGYAIFLPSGSPYCPIIRVDTSGNFITKLHDELLFGRPIIFKDKLYSIVYDIKTNRSSIVEINENLGLLHKVDIT